MIAHSVPGGEHRRAIPLDPRGLFDLDRPTTRRNLVLTLLVAAFVSPNVSLPLGLPAVRFEQLLLAVYLPSLVAYHVHHPEARRMSRLDLAFGVIVAAFSASILLAPLFVPQVGRSGHDLFDALRPIEYWLLYRTARLLPAVDEHAVELVALTAAGAIVSGTFALAQRYGPAAFNDIVTAIWTGPGHNLAGVKAGGRAVGTVGNPNNFGVLCALLLLVLFVVALLRSQPKGRAGVVAWSGLALAAGGLVLSQSRSASLPVAGAAFLGLLVLLVTRTRPSLLRPIAVVAVAITGTTALVAATPPAHSSSIVQRFDPAIVGDDTSLVIRLARLQLAFAHPDPTIQRRLSCEADPAGVVLPGHEPQPPETAASGAASGAGADSSAAAARDEQRMRDVAAIATRIRGAFCRTGRWPTGSVDALYAPGSAPRDPSTAAPYQVGLTADGYSVSAQLEVADSPAGPTYTLSSSPDMVMDPSFERGLADWEVGASTDASTVAGGRFGKTAARIGSRAGSGIHQYVMYLFPRQGVYTAQVWARSTDGRAASASLLVDAWLTNGDRISPLVQRNVSLPANGRWVPISVRLEMPAAGQVWVLQLSLIHGTVGGPIDLDGAIVAAGEPAPSFASLPEVDPTQLPSAVPSFWASPVLGLGSLANFELGAFDNEYAYVTVHFGFLGLAAYVVLFLVALGEFALAWWRRRQGPAAAFALALGLFTLVVLVFDVAAGAFFSYQLMAIYWLLAGSVAATIGVRHETEPPVLPTGARSA